MRASVRLGHVSLRSEIVVLAFGLGAAVASAQGAGAGPPALKDQFGKPDSLAAHRGRPVIALVVDPDHLRQAKSFELDLRQRFDGLDFIRVVQIPQQPGIRPEGVARKLRAKVSQDVSVLIDEDNVWASVYGLETHEASVLLFDRESRMLARFEGRYEPGVVERISAEIESGLGLVRQPPTPAN